MSALGAALMAAGIVASWTKHPVLAAWLVTLAISCMVWRWGGWDVAAFVPFCGWIVWNEAERHFTT